MSMYIAMRYSMPVPVCVSWRLGAANSYKEAQYLWQHIFTAKVMHHCKNIMHTLEMQQYIDISSYRDTLGSDTVSIHI